MLPVASEAGMSQPGQCGPVAAANHSTGQPPPLAGPCTSLVLSLLPGDTGARQLRAGEAAGYVLPRGTQPNLQAVVGGKGFKAAQALQPHRPEFKS